jgi:hypothetical protein
MLIFGHIQNQPRFYLGTIDHHGTPVAITMAAALLA